MCVARGRIATRLPTTTPLPCPLALKPPPPPPPPPPPGVSQTCQHPLSQYFWRVFSFFFFFISLICSFSTMYHYEWSSGLHFFGARYSPLSDTTVGARTLPTVIDEPLTHIKCSQWSSMPEYALPASTDIIRRWPFRAGPLICVCSVHNINPALLRPLSRSLSLQKRPAAAAGVWTCHVSCPFVTANRFTSCPFVTLNGFTRQAHAGRLTVWMAKTQPKEEGSVWVNSAWKAVQVFPGACPRQERVHFEACCTCRGH